MRFLDTMKAPSLVAAILVVGLVLSLAACSDNTVGVGDYDDPLELTGVRWQDPDSSGTPEELKPGDRIALEGSNMNAVARVYFNGIEASFNPALASEDYLVVTVPGDLPFGELDPASETFNTIRVENNSSEAQMDFPILPSPPELQEMSNEHAQPGSEVTLYGQYLYLVESITFPNDVTISGDDVEAAADGSSVTFTLPSEVSAEANSNISITTAGGSGESAPSFYFHDTRGMLFNADDHADWGGWNALWSTDTENQDLISDFRSGAEGEFAIMRANGVIPANNNDWWADNRVVNLANQQWIAPEHLDESLENFAVKFELDVRQEWEAGAVQIYLLETASPDNYGTGYAALVRLWEQPDGTVSTASWDGWRTVTVPFSEFRTSAGQGEETAPDLRTLLGDDGTVGGGGPDGNPTSFRLVNYSDREVPEGQAFAVDNIRVVRIAEPDE